MRLDFIRLDDVLQAVRDNPGLNSTELAEIVTGVSMSSLDRTKRVSLQAKMGSKLALLRKQGWVEGTAELRPRWRALDEPRPQPYVKPFRRSKHIFQWKGEELCLAEICRREGLCYDKVRCRVSKGWTLDDAMQGAER